MRTHARSCVFILVLTRIFLFKYSRLVVVFAPAKAKALVRISKYLTYKKLNYNKIFTISF